MHIVDFFPLFPLALGILILARRRLFARLQYMFLVENWRTAEPTTFNLALTTVAGVGLIAVGIGLFMTGLR